jgi:hypothetical protein
VVEDLTAGLLLVVAAVAAAYSAVLMKCFKLVTIAQRFVSTEVCTALTIDRVHCMVKKE